MNSEILTVVKKLTPGHIIDFIRIITICSGLENLTLTSPIEGKIFFHL